MNMEREILDLRREMAELRGRVPNLPVRNFAGGGGGALVKWFRLTGAEAYAPNRWDYSWTLMQWDAASGVLVPTNVEVPVTNGTDGYTTARNSLESNNPADLATATGTLAIGVTLPLLVGALMPFGTWTGQTADVPGWLVQVVVDGATVLRPVFAQANSIDC